MVMIHAYIKPLKLAAVALALRAHSKLSGMSVCEIKGFGRGKALDTTDAISEEAGDFMPAVKIELVCDDEMAPELIELIRDAAHTGLRGDGKIYTSRITDALRISTGESGNTAV